MSGYLGDVVALTRKDLLRELRHDFAVDDGRGRGAARVADRDEPPRGLGAGGGGKASRRKHQGCDEHDCEPAAAAAVRTGVTFHESSLLDHTIGTGGKGQGASCKQDACRGQPGGV